MLDIKLIRENADQVKKACVHKNLNPDTVDEVLRVDKERRELIVQIEAIRAKRNTLNDQLKKERTPELIGQSVALKTNLEEFEPRLRQVEVTFDQLMLQIPNVPLEEVPVGKDESGNQVVRTWGEKPVFDFEPKNHVEIAQDLDLIDFERGSKVAGFRGYFLKNEAVLLQFGLMQYTLQKFIAKGYTPITPPVILKKRNFINTGHFPWGEKETYQFKADEDSGDEYFLAGTAEVPLVSLHQDEIFAESELPKKYIGFSPCYRREAGNYGKDTNGVYRVHEFVKTEQVIICKNDLEVSRELHEEMMQLTEEIAQDLKLPYRVLLMCTGDMGEPQAKKYDLECAMVSHNGWGELASDSIMTDFQSRRANIRYRDAKNELQYVHLLNNTASNSPRWLVAILENYQQVDGSVKIPTVLIPYVGCDTIKSKK